MTAKRRLCLQIVILLSLLFIFILEAFGVGKYALFVGIGGAFVATAMLSRCNRYLIVPLFVSDWLLIAC